MGGDGPDDRLVSLVRSLFFKTGRGNERDSGILSAIGECPFLKHLDP